MNILFIKHFFVGCMVYEIPRVSVFRHCPYSVTFPYIYILTYIKSTIVLYILSTIFEAFGKSFLLLMHKYVYKYYLLNTMYM